MAHNNNNMCPICDDVVEGPRTAGCSKCHQMYHFLCLKLPSKLSDVIGLQSDWLCNDCKVCSICRSPKQQSDMVLCDGCDKGFHISCLDPPLQQLPSVDWYCLECDKHRQHSSIRTRRVSAGVSPTSNNASSNPSTRPRRNLANGASFKISPIMERIRKRKMSGAVPEIESSPKRRNLRRSTDVLSNERAELNERLRQNMMNSGDLDISQITTAADLTMFNKARDIWKEKQEMELTLLPENKDHTVVVIMGKYSMVACNVAPYPQQFSGLKHLFLCEFCLKPHASATVLKRHSAKCVWKHPPGNEIFRQGTNSVWEVDGKIMRLYCQNVCLLSKMFLDHKTLYFDVDPFLFYILTEADSQGCHMVGYFSKEKESMMNYNLSCLLTLPPYQRKGYGHMLIQFSYLLSVVEKRIGSPEHPLSDLGLLTYRNYWKDTILVYILNLQDSFKQGGSICIKDMSAETGIHVNDLMSTLQWMGMVKNWKGQYFIYTRPEIMKEAKLKAKKLGCRQKMTARRLLWTPFHQRDTPANSPAST